jgi:hypothetical protein
MLNEANYLMDIPSISIDIGGNDVSTSVLILNRGQLRINSSKTPCEPYVLEELIW